MTYTAHPQGTNELSGTTWRVITAIAAVPAVIAAALGVWMAYATANGTITLLGRTWNASELSEVWAPILMIVGGFIIALAVGTDSIRRWNGVAGRWLVALESLVAVAGAVVFVIGVGLLV